MGDNLYAVFCRQRLFACLLIDDRPYACNDVKDRERIFLKEISTDIEIDP